MKPIAYVSKEDLRDMETHLCDLSKKPDKEKIIPIYTFRELTDEEIATTWDDVRKDATLKPSMKDVQDFARTILKKAIEK
jgi:predicted SnoaL-like aldol condensation-catalyzing enzyme